MQFSQEKNSIHLHLLVSL